MCNSRVLMCSCSSPDGSLLSKLVCPSLRHFQENRGGHLKLQTFLGVRHLSKQHVFFTQMLHGVTTVLNLSLFFICPGSSETCLSGDGSSYRGDISRSASGRRCLVWNYFTYLGSSQGLGKHNHCR